MRNEGAICGSARLYIIMETREWAFLENGNATETLLKEWALG
jgi:hypothetical protein